MDLLRFADDSALTPISELRQAAKGRAKETEQKLSSALDSVAQEMAYPRWDALVEASWVLHPPGTAENLDPHNHLLIRHSRGRRSLISLALPSEEEAGSADLSLTVHDWMEGGIRQQALIVRNDPRQGRTLTLSDEEKASLQSARTLQARVRAIAPIALAAAQDDIPRMVGRPRSPADNLEAISNGPVPSVDTVHVLAEIPGEKSSYEAVVGIGESRASLLARLRTEETPGLGLYRIQKNGSIVARRAKLETRDGARYSLEKAIRVISFLSWTGLEYPRGREHNRAHHDANTMANGDLYDHYHVLRDHKSGATVVLNQPYSGHHAINNRGLLNLIKPGTRTAEAPPFASLQGLSRILFHSPVGQGADLAAIVDGATAAALIARNTKIEITAKSVRAPKTATSKKPSSSKPLSPASDLQLDLSAIPRDEARLLEDDLLSIEQLKTPYWRNKMKAFRGEELLSWDLQDKYQDTGITLDDVIESLRACPLDSDIWGFLHLFDFSEVMKAECFRRGAVAGEIYLGRKFFAEEEGSFWGLLETRPYMRCMTLLYRSLVKMERAEDAFAIGKRMLELCPNDNIGIRFSIEDVEAAIGDSELSSDLAQAFKEQDMASSLD